VSSTHQSVLINELIEGLSLSEELTVVDGTLNGGGHAEVVLKRIGKGGTFVGIDLDSRAIERAKVRLKDYSTKKIFVEDNFRNLGSILTAAGIQYIDRAYFDLGLSSDQLENSGRGFSFLRHEPLLMTMRRLPTEAELTAQNIVNSWSSENLENVLLGYGEERFYKRIVKVIVQAREEHPIEFSDQLAGIVQRAVPGWYRHRKVHPATKTFQALRIAVNDELGSLKEGLGTAIARTRSGGRIAVISFESLSDRVVKNQFKQHVAAKKARLITRRPITPTMSELRDNPRARSSKLRILEII